jgi:hypothetical protein
MNPQTRIEKMRGIAGEQHLTVRAAIYQEWLWKKILEG